LFLSIGGGAAEPSELVDELAAFPAPLAAGSVSMAGG